MNNEKQKKFRLGKVPSPMPNGFYKGLVEFYHGSWVGKKFNSKNKTGVNIFKKNNETKEHFKFITSVGKGVKDPFVDVLKIDYNIPGNAWWLRMVLDEIVEIEPGRYLGKANIRLPFITLTVAYFYLEKSE